MFCLCGNFLIGPSLQEAVKAVRSLASHTTILLFLQDVPEKKRKLQYDRLNLQRAFEATQRGVSVYRASRDYSVPESKLRDRTRGLVDLDVKIGFDRIFSAQEEEKLVGHVSYMAEIRYG